MTETAILSEQRFASEAALSAEDLLPANRVLLRYRVSDMTLFRWLRDKNFPPPIRIGNRRYWRVAALREWEEAQYGK